MPDSLDSLYGKGTSKAFKSACGGDVVEVSVKGGVRAYVSWDDGSTMKIDCTPERIHFQTLESKKKGLYTRLVDDLSEVFRGRVWTATAADEESREILMKRGDWEADGLDLRRVA